jgi:hypothetical protein
VAVVAVEAVQLQPMVVVAVQVVVVMVDGLVVHQLMVLQEQQTVVVAVVVVQDWLQEFHLQEVLEVLAVQVLLSLDIKEKIKCHY